MKRRLAGGERAGPLLKDEVIRNKKHSTTSRRFNSLCVTSQLAHPHMIAHTDPVQKYLLVDSFEVCQDVFHAAFLQRLTGVGLSKTVDAHTVGLIHLALHETTARLPDRHDV